MSFRFFNTSISVSVPFCLMVTFLLIIDTTNLFIISFLTVALHEIGHYVALRKLNLAPKELKLTLNGIFIVAPTCFSSKKEEVKVALFGPFFNLIAIIVFTALYVIFKNVIFIKVSLVNFTFGVFNMLPINGLDGGTVVAEILNKFLGQAKGQFVFRLISLTFGFFMVFGGVYMLISGFKNPSLLIVGIYLCILNFIKV